MDVGRQENRSEVASRVLQAWGLDADERAKLLDSPDAVNAVLSIYESLQVIYYEAQDRALQWPVKPNREFKGKSAVDLMLNGDIERVRKYLKYHVYNA